MDFRRRFALAAVVLIGVLVAALLIDMALQDNSAEADSGLSLPREIVVSRGDLTYGPQSWRPYAVPIAIGPDELPAGNWYFAFIDLGCVPVSGNPALFRTGSVRVDHIFSDLAGTAAFNVYGLRDGDGRAWTNRQMGYGTSGYFVSGNASPGEPSLWASPLPESDRYTIELAGAPEFVDDDIGRETRTLWFERLGSGLDGLHITADPSVRKGQLTETDELEGSFYITYTGGNSIGDLILMVAVDRPQPADFELRLTSEFVEDG
jgi:hypothetical protein